jgi:hypothetical protein
MGDAEVEGTSEYGLAIGDWVGVAEILPKAERQ